MRDPKILCKFTPCTPIPAALLNQGCQRVGQADVLRWGGADPGVFPVP